MDVVYRRCCGIDVHKCSVAVCVSIWAEALTVDHSTIGRWVLRYASELHKRTRREIRPPNGSWRVDETFVRVPGKWTNLNRAVDSTGETIDFILSPKRDAVAAKYFLQVALWRTGQVRPRVINVDGHAAYPAAIAELKASGKLGHRCRCRPCPYLNNVLEQDYRFVKKCMAASLWFRSAEGRCGRSKAARRCA